MGPRDLGTTLGPKMELRDPHVSARYQTSKRRKNRRSRRVRRQERSVEWADMIDPRSCSVRPTVAPAARSRRGSRKAHHGGHSHRGSHSASVERARPIHHGGSHHDGPRHDHRRDRVVAAVVRLVDADRQPWAVDTRSRTPGPARSSGPQVKPPSRTTASPSHFGAKFFIVVHPSGRESPLDCDAELRGWRRTDRSKASVVPGSDQPGPRGRTRPYGYENQQQSVKSRSSPGCG